ncbi:MAG: DUF4957 domain-containing protein [Bacteroidales bacterium]|nr:DUF4957 domain-containing protein [Bacteroidales bacterium]
MKQARRVLWLMPITACLFLTSCIDGFDDDETYTSDVKHQQVSTPVLKDSANAEGTQAFVMWPVVHGASGYTVSVLNVTDEDHPDTLVNNKTIDAVKFSFKREDDQYYDVKVVAIGNTKYHNTNSDTALLRVSSFVEQLGDEIPSGSDLAEIIPTMLTQYAADKDSTAEFGINLEPGGEFTISGKIDLKNYQATICSTNPNKPAKIVMSATTGFVTQGGVKFKNLLFDCENFTDKNDAILCMSSAPTFEKTGPQYWTTFPILVQNCRTKNLKARLIADGGTPWVIQNVLIKKCIIEVDQEAQSKTKNGSGYCDIIEFGAGFCVNFSIENSTVYSTTTLATASASMPTIFRNGSKKLPGELLDGSTYKECTYSINNSTFVNISKATSGSNAPMFYWLRQRGQSYCTVTNKNNIYVDCAGRRVKRYSLLAGQNGNMGAVFSNNVYNYTDATETVLVEEEWNTYPNPDQVEFEAQLVLDEETGIWKVGNADVIAAGCGDPRGLE